MNASGKKRRISETSTHNNSTTPANNNHLNSPGGSSKPPLPPAKKGDRCSSVDRILDSPVKKSARILDANSAEGLVEQQRKTKSVDDLLDETPEIAITDHSHEQEVVATTLTPSQSPSPEKESPERDEADEKKLVAATEGDSLERCSLTKDCQAHRGRRSTSVLSTDESIHSTDSGSDPARRKHFLGKYVQRMKHLLKK